MTKKEAVLNITSELKWYVGVYSQGYASQFVQRFKAGQLKEKTINSFLEKFGYERTKEEQWEKCPVNTMEK